MARRSFDLSLLGAVSAVRTGNFECQEHQLSWLNILFSKIILFLPFVDGLIFYFFGVLSSILLFKLAKQWREVLSAFQRVLDILSCEPYGPLPGWSLKKRIRFASLALLILALIEHLMAWSSFIYERIYQYRECDWKIESWFYYIATTHLSQIYKRVPLNPATVAWSEYMNASFTFAWNFIDLFIIIISLTVASMFEKINRRLEFFQGRVSLSLAFSTEIIASCLVCFQIVNDDLWEEVRHHYNQVCELHDFIDRKIGDIVSLACLNDLYYVCLQLINVAT